jgi:hypothetical protein
LDGATYIEHRSLDPSCQSKCSNHWRTASCLGFNLQLRYASSGASCSNLSSAGSPEWLTWMCNDHPKEQKSRHWRRKVLQSVGSLGPQTGEYLAFHARRVRKCAAGVNLGKWAAEKPFPGTICLDRSKGTFRAIKLPERYVSFLVLNLKGLVLRLYQCSRPYDAASAPRILVWQC